MGFAHSPFRFFPVTTPAGSHLKTVTMLTALSCTTTSIAYSGILSTTLGSTPCSTAAADTSWHFKGCEKAFADTLSVQAVRCGTLDGNPDADHASESKVGALICGRMSMVIFKECLAPDRPRPGAGAQLL